MHIHSFFHKYTVTVLLYIYNGLLILLLFIIINSATNGNGMFFVLIAEFQYQTFNYSIGSYIRVYLDEFW